MPVTAGAGTSLDSFSGVSGSGAGAHAEVAVTSSANAANANLLAMLAASQQQHQQQLVAAAAMPGMATVAPGSSALAYQGAAFPSSIDLVS